MKIRSSRVFGAASITLGVLGLLAGCSVATEDESAENGDEGLTLPPIALFDGAAALGPAFDSTFVVTGLAHKCVDFGGEAYQAVGSPVILYACNGSVAQNVRVVEIADGSRDVSLRASKGLCFGVHDGVAVGHALELQTCDPSNQAQRFALDGDAIYVGNQKAGNTSRANS